MIVFIKNKSVQVAVATNQEPSTPIENSKGEVSFKYVARIDPMSLKDTEDVQEFACILISTLKWT